MGCAAQGSGDRYVRDEMTTNLLEEVRGMMPGHARENWSLEERNQDDIDTAAMDKYGVKWRTTPSHHKVGIDDEGKVTKGNPNHPAVGGISGAKQGKLFDTGKRTGPEKGAEYKPRGKAAEPEKKAEPKASGGGGGGGAPKQKLPKFDDSKKGHLDHLKSKGWDVKTIGPDMKPMKVPHATSPSGKTRLYFKKQSVHVSQKGWKGAKHDLHNAHSMTDDHRTMNPEQLHAHVEKHYKESVEARPVRQRLSEIRQRFEQQERDRPLHHQIAEIRDTIHRGPSWSYPDWALPKTEFSEE
jgi:hypothetical protein